MHFNNLLAGEFENCPSVVRAGVPTSNFQVNRMPKRKSYQIILAITCLPFMIGVSSFTSTSNIGLANNVNVPPTLSVPEDTALYIVFHRDQVGTILPVFVKEIQLTSRLETKNPAQIARELASTSRNYENLKVTLRLSGGEITFQDVVQVPRWYRGEFHGTNPEGTIDGHIFPMKSVYFTVRIPFFEASTLALADNKSNNLAAFSTMSFVEQIRETDQFLDKDGTTISQSIVDPSNRVDLLIMGDGYTSLQEDKFILDASNMASAFFSISPYQEYKNYFTVHTLFSPSNESGADHPPYDAGCAPVDSSCCADTAMLSDPLQGTFVDTAFSSYFCRNNVHQLLWTDTSAVYAAASAVPEWDLIMLLVNDTTYGGAGGSILTASLNSWSVNIAQHELGHSFVDLADEYEIPYSGYPTCSDVTGPACEANITDVTSRNDIKWNPWIEPTTPIPTVPEFDPAYANVVGLFEGARYLSSGMFRSGQSCIMRAIDAPYCQVPSQSFVLKLYNGGWGIPSNGISMFEPNSFAPSSGTITLTHPATQTFSADILEPIGGPLAQITWYVDGVPIQGETENSFDYTTSSGVPGPVEITLRVEDGTALVHPDMAGNSLQFEHVWMVNIELNYSVFLPMIEK
jgi:hypothetical protein